jgi:hypothetical protein
MKAFSRMPLGRTLSDLVTLVSPVSLLTLFILFALPTSTHGCRQTGLQTPTTASSDGELDQLAATIPALPCPTLDEELASKLVSLSLACTDKQFPNKPGNIVEGLDTVRSPRELTPAFYGCFDWHSAVHGHWAMVRVLRTVPSIAQAPALRARLDAHLIPPLIAAELAYARAERNTTFERPYGWGWMLRLQAELLSWKDPDARRWAAALAPLADFIGERSRAYLMTLSVPVRDGTHQNTAFAMIHMLAYARAATKPELERTVVQRAKDFYFQDHGCPTAYEPSGEDFISPCLVEADLMRRVLTPAEFGPWYDAFMPAMSAPAFARLRAPVEVRDLRDPRIGHLIGLSLQRAWAMNGIASALPESDRRAALLRQIGRRHCHEALHQLFDAGYGGEHWLATFALYLLSNADE